MPYTTPAEREPYQRALREIAELLADKPKGHLTYCVYFLAIQWIPKKCYADISAAVGALEDAAHELRRRHLDLYENEKLVENGDVF